MYNPTICFTAMFLIVGVIGGVPLALFELYLKIDEYIWKKKKEKDLSN